MKKINFALFAVFSLSTISVYSSDLRYSVTGQFENVPQLIIQGELPSNFLEKDQNFEKEFEIPEGPSQTNRKYKASFYNSTEHAPKRKVVVSLSKFNQETKNYIAINQNFYFFEDTKFWFVGQTFLTPENVLAIGFSHKSLWKLQ